VRLYTAPPLIPERSGLARLQARLWADEDMRVMIARRMYTLRLGEVLPHRNLDVLRGIVRELMVYPRMREKSYDSVDRSRSSSTAR
jgi:hypothetical protein